MRGSVRGSAFRLRFRHIRGAGGVVRVCRGGGARGGGDGSLGLQLPPQPVRRSSGCGAEANWYVENLGKINGQRGWGDEWRGGRGGWQARCRGGNPGAHTPSATGGELRQSRLVLGLLHLGEHVPALAWGMVRGSARERGRGREGQDLGRMGLGQGACRCRVRGGSGRAIGLGLGPGPGLGLGPHGLGHGHTQELLSVSVARFGRQERPLLLAKLHVCGGVEGEIGGEGVTQECGGGGCATVRAQLAAKLRVQLRAERIG